MLIRNKTGTKNALIGFAWPYATRQICVNCLTTVCAAFPWSCHVCSPQSKVFIKMQRWTQIYIPLWYVTRLVFRLAQHAISTLCGDEEKRARRDTLTLTQTGTEEYSNSLLNKCTYCSALPCRKEQLSFQIRECSRTGKGDKYLKESWGHLISCDTALPLPQIIQAWRGAVGDRFLKKRQSVNNELCMSVRAEGDRRHNFPGVPLDHSPVTETVGILGAQSTDDHLAAF